jgi:hypothetical protein
MNEKEQSSAPPLLGSWRRLYMTVLANLIFWLVVFYIFRRIFE